MAVEYPNVKELQKLAKACRKAGIRTFKGFGFEFTLDDAPEAPRASHKPHHGVTDSIESDELTPEQLLMWSVGDINIEDAAS